MTLPADLADFFGPDIVTRDITYRGKTRAFSFRVLGGDAAEQTFKPAPDGVGFRSKVIAAVACLDDGRPAFTAEEAAEIPNAFQNILVEHCFELNGIGDKARDDAGNAPLA